MLAIIKLIDSKEGMEWVRQEWGGREGFVVLRVILRHWTQ